MDEYFTDEKIAELVTKHNWEMVPAGGGRHKLRQKDMNYMETVEFMATEEAVSKFCVTTTKP
jgi:hypothetical protein